MAARATQHVENMIEVYPERATLDIPKNDDQVVFRRQTRRRRDLADPRPAFGALRPEQIRGDRSARGLAVPRPSGTRGMLDR